MSDRDALLLRLPAIAENLALIRGKVGAHAEELGISERTLADLRTVVTEACTNVVRHAYADRDKAGPIEVEVDRQRHDLLVVVRDFGGGIRPRPDGDLPSLRLGLPVIGVLSSGFDLFSVRDHGTEIKIRLSLSGAA